MSTGPRVASSTIRRTTFAPARCPAEQERAEQEGLERPTRPRVELVEDVRGDRDEHGGRGRARAPQRPEGDPDELQRAGRRARAEMRAEAALRAAPEVVREAERRDGRDFGRADGDDGADERQAEPADVASLRRERREEHVAELAATMRVAREVPARRAVHEIELHLAHLEPGTQGVDRGTDPACQHGHEAEPAPHRRQSQYEPDVAPAAIDRIDVGEAEQHALNRHRGNDTDPADQPA